MFPVFEALTAGILMGEVGQSRGHHLAICHGHVDHLVVRHRVDRDGQYRLSGDSWTDQILMSVNAFGKKLIIVK